MKKKSVAVIGLLLLAALVLAACAPKEEMPAEMPQESVEEAMPAEEVEEPHDEDDDAMDAEEHQDDDMDGEAAETEDHEDDMAAEEVDVEAMIAAKAAGQHDLGFILGKDKTREEWDETLDRMIGYGAEISAEEKEVIIDYLLSLGSSEDDMAAEEVDVEALIEEKVAGQHDLGRIFNADKTREEWEETLDRMIGYGAKISDEEKEIIIEYLLNR